MNKLSFFKGILIASVLSVVFWSGAAIIVINMEDQEVPQEQIQNKEMKDNTYALL